MKKIYSFIKQHFELLFLSGGLFYLLFIDPYNPPGFTFCLLKNVGFEYCPGCGMGRSISYIFYGDLSASFETHPVGFLALILILLRIGALIYKLFKNKLIGEVYNG